MKSLLTTLTLLLLLLSANAAHAQGWLFGKACTCDGADGWPVATDGKGAVYMAGVFNGGTLPVTFGGKSAPPPLYAYWQTVWAKFDLKGNIQWVDGTISGDTYVENITTDPAGNLILFGSFSSAKMQIGSFTLNNAYWGGNPQYFIAKINPSGTVLWAVNDGNIDHLFLSLKRYIMSVGGVSTDTAGNIYIASSFYAPTMNIGGATLVNADASGKTNDMFVAKYTPSGALVWATSIGGGGDDYALGVTVPPNGNVYISGAFYSPSVAVGPVVLSNSSSQTKACIASFSGATGKPLWAESAGGSSGAIAIGITSDVNNNVYLTGSFNDAAITFGSSTFTRPFPASAPSFASFLVQYSPANVVTWGKCLGSLTGDIYCYSITTASCGEVWVSGSYYDKVVIAPGDTLAVVPGGDPVFVAGYNLSGGVAGYSGVGAGGDDQINIVADAAGNIYLCSDNYSSLTVGPDILPAVSHEAMFIAKYANSAPQDTVKGIDTTFCVGKGSTLTASNGSAMYYWSDGAYGQVHAVTKPGKYYVFGMTCGKPVQVDTFNLTAYTDITTSRRNDTSACITSGKMTLSALPSSYSWLWSTGNTNQSISVTAAGTYWVSSIENCIKHIDTIKVASITRSYDISLGNDTTFCRGNTYRLYYPQLQGYSYLWGNGSTDSFIDVTASGVYQLTVNNGWCLGSDSIHVNVISVPSAIDLGHDTALCMGHTVILSVKPEEYTNYSWSNDNHDSKIAVTESGSYWLSAYNICGSVSDTIQFDFRHCEIWLPTAFTPNGDGLNDILRALGLFNFISKFSLSIYNRYGQRVYYSEDLLAGWDGTFNGSRQDLGTYYYVMDFILEGKKQMIKGDVELIR